MTNMNYKSRIALGIALAAIIPFLYWLSGFDLNERGIMAMTCAMWTIGMFVIGVTCPCFDKDK